MPVSILQYYADAKPIGVPLGTQYRGISFLKRPEQLPREYAVPWVSYCMLGNLAYISAAREARLDDTNCSAAHLKVRLFQMLRSEVAEKSLWKRRATEADTDVAKLTRVLFAIMASSRENEQLIQKIVEELESKSEQNHDFQIIKQSLCNLDGHGISSRVWSPFTRRFTDWETRGLVMPGLDISFSIVKHDPLLSGSPSLMDISTASTTSWTHDFSD